MAEIKVRGLGAEVVAKIDELAEKRKISREEYLRRHLTHLAAIGEVKEVEEKYATLINNLAEVLQMNTDAMERIVYYLETH
jgi:hypothetical protein